MADITPIEQRRASKIQYFTRRFVISLADTLYGTVCVDILPPLATNQHYIIEQLWFTGEMLQQTNGFDGPLTFGQWPTTGLFLCPPETAVPTFVNFASPNGYNPDYRPLALPLTDLVRMNLITEEPAGVFRYSLGMVIQPGRYTIPEKWFVRALVVLQPGNIYPGFLAGSHGWMNMLASVEENIGSYAQEGPRTTNGNAIRNPCC